MKEHEKRIREALEAGPTEGPWIHNHDDVIASPDPEDVVAQCSWAKTRPVATAQFIAACDPTALRALLSDIEAMRGALEGAYSLAIGHAATYKFQHELEDVHPTHQAILDAARAALKGAEA